MIWNFLFPALLSCFEKNSFKKFHFHFFSAYQQLHTEHRVKRESKNESNKPESSKRIPHPLPWKGENHIASRWPANSYSKLFLSFLLLTLVRWPYFSSEKTDYLPQLNFRTTLYSKSNPTPYLSFFYCLHAAEFMSLSLPLNYSARTQSSYLRKSWKLIIYNKIVLKLNKSLTRRQCFPLLFLNDSIVEGFKDIKMILIFGSSFCFLKSQMWSVSLFCCWESSSLRSQDQIRTD